MSRILVRAHKDPFDAASAQRTLASNLIGNNVGNLVFAQAVHRLLTRPDQVLGTSKLSPFDAAQAAVVDAEYDHLVLPLANAFRPSFATRLEELTELVERLSIPVSVLGVGVQGGLSGSTVKADRISPVVQRFVRAVLRRSPSIGVRGEATATYLRRLGFGDDEVEVIGCPSLFGSGATLPPPRLAAGVDRGSAIALTVSPYLRPMGPVSLRWAEQYPQLRYLAQDHLTLQLMLTGHYPGADGSGRDGQDDGLPTTLTHPLLAEDRTRFCLDPAVWVDHLRGYDFCVGTRIHGAIAAVLAGTPAVVLAHDSRTLELADYHQIPRRTLRSVTSDTDPAALYADADWQGLTAGHPQRWDRFRSLLRRHGLRHAYDPGGDAGAAFDASLQSVSFPPPVRVASRPGTRWRNRLLTRSVRWSPPARRILSGV